MRKIMRCLTTTAIVATIWGGMSIGASAAPYTNLKYELSQPDGSKVQVKITGDEYFQQVESLDGYTLCRDKDGWICYAKLNDDSTDYVSTGEIYKNSSELSDSKFAVNANNKSEKTNLQKHLKIKKEAIKTKVNKVRKNLHADDYISSSLAKSNIDNNIDNLLDSNAQASSLSNVQGLTILVNFTDQDSDISKSDINDFLNGVGYTGYGNNGSVRDFYYDVSGGKLTYTNNVIGFYTAKQPKSYYDDLDEETGTYTKANELTEEVFQWLKTQNFDSSKITKDANGYAKAVNILYAGKPVAGWAKGLWPHQAWYGKNDNINGIKIQKYEMSNIGDDLSIYTICHESGHMIYGYPDLYDYDGDSNGTGAYSLMSGNSDEKNPIPPDPYCRNVISGWNTPTIMNSYSDGTKLEAVSDTNGNQYSYKWTGNNPKEYFLVENIQKKGRYATSPDSGLAIWHVDENGDNSKNQMTSSNHFLVSIEQADGKFDLEKNRNAGNVGDLFKSGYKYSFNDSTSPNSKWWNGTSSGLNISQISASGNKMTFVKGIGDSNPGNNPDPTNPDTSKDSNIAGQATATSSYVSDWETIKALNDGKDPKNSNDKSNGAYGNWPKTGSQWVEYQFNKNFTLSGSDVYWFKDGQGVDVPASYRILYWDGQAWQDVKNATGFGTEINKYNTTTFTPVSTNAIAIEMESNGSSSTGILEWKVYGK